MTLVGVPQMVHSLCLIDPVTMLICHPQLLSNFIYKVRRGAHPLVLCSTAHRTCRRLLGVRCTAAWW